MKKRMHLKRRRKFNILFLVIILVLILFLLTLVKFINIKPLVISYSEIEANKLATLVINTAIEEENILENTNLYEINNNVISYNTKQINEILISLTARIQKYFSSLESGNISNINEKILQKYNDESLKKGVLLYLPMGYLTGSPFLANYGPRIPLKISLIGDVKTDIRESITDYGLNNALLKIYIYVEVMTQSLIPFISSVQKTAIEYPIVLKLIEGKVPSFYLENR